MSEWRCEVCFVSNEDATNICICCESSRPGTTKTNDIFGANALETKSGFTVNNNSTMQGPIKFGINFVSVSDSKSGDVSEIDSNNNESNDKENTDRENNVAFGISQGKVRTQNKGIKPDGENEVSSVENGKILNVKGKIKVEAVPDIHSKAKPVGDAFTWGTGECDQLALLSSEVTETWSVEYPTQIKNPQIKAVDVACGALHTATLSADGHVYTWGCNDDFTLGRNGKMDAETDEAMSDGERCNENGDVDDPNDEDNDDCVERFPALIENMLEKVTQISCGDNHSACVTSSGSCYIWGTYKDSGGYIGFPDYSCMKGTIKTKKMPTATKVPLPAPVDILRSGENHTCVFTTEKELFVWGSGEFGQLALPLLGDHDDKTPYLYPQKIDLGGIVTKDNPINGVWTGKATTFITTESRVHGCGRNSRCEVGIGNADSTIVEFTELDSLRNIKIQSITGGQYFTCLLTKGRDVYTWGHKEHVGHGSIEKDVKEPKQIQHLQNIVSLSAGGDSTYCTDEDGTAYAWGEGQMYQLGNGDDDSEPVLHPTVISQKHFKNRFVTQITGGSQHAVSIVWDGTYAKEGTKAGRKRKRERGDKSPDTQRERLTKRINNGRSEELVDKDDEPTQIQKKRGRKPKATNAKEETSHYSRTDSGESGTIGTRLHKRHMALQGSSNPPVVSTSKKNTTENVTEKNQTARSKGRPRKIEKEDQKTSKTTLLSNVRKCPTSRAVYRYV